MLPMLTRLKLLFAFAIAGLSTDVLTAATPPHSFTITPGAPLLVRNGVEMPSMLGCTVSFSAAPEADRLTYETGTSTSAAYAPFIVDFVGSEFDCPATASSFNVYKTDARPCYVWIRSVNTTGGHSGWVLVGDVSAYLMRPLALAPLSSTDRATIIATLHISAGEAPDPVKRQTLLDVADFIERYPAGS